MTCSNKSLLTLNLVAALVLTSNITLADSPRSWGYWDAATAAGPNDGGNDGFSTMTNSQNINNVQNQNNGNNLNDSQNDTRFNRGSVQLPNATLAALPEEYVGYTFCVAGCAKGADSVGKFNLTLREGEQTSNKTSGRKEVATYDNEFDATGKYNGVSFAMNNESAKTTVNKRTARSGKVFYKRNMTDGSLFDVTLDDKINGESKLPYTKGGIAFWPSKSVAFLGKPVDATSIAAQLRLGQSYNFRGKSMLGSNVKITVDFLNASWKGRWSKAGKVHNGFRANGGIDGATLLSTKVKGLGKKRNIGFVKGGQVDATLVGVINGRDASKAGVIGSTVINVKQKRGTKVIGDVFSTKAIVK